MLGHPAADFAEQISDALISSSFFEIWQVPPILWAEPWGK
ncbi:MAG: hypothetical protein M2R45_03230 [Verrucomicrobia subdivision 3 bacterium]|nr:hypothetical protein [Limisphaerales bacterium]MCS1416091.1 hypothetical protein [Limisphaerales bacterium]